MTAALAAAEEGLSVLVVEKAKKFGGSTGISGGGVWIPNNPTLRRRGHDDSRQSIRRYLDLLTEGRVPGERLDAFIDNGPRRSGRSEEHTSELQSTNAHLVCR